MGVNLANMSAISNQYSQVSQLAPIPGLGGPPIIAPTIPGRPPMGYSGGGPPSGGIYQNLNQMSNIPLQNSQISQMVSKGPPQQNFRQPGLNPFYIDPNQANAHDEFSDLSYLRNNAIGGNIPQVGTGHAPNIGMGETSGRVGPAVASENQIGEYDFSDHEIDPKRLTGEEEKHFGDPRFD